MTRNRRTRNVRSFKTYFHLFAPFFVPLVCITVAGSIFDWLLMLQGVPRLGLLLISNFLTGIVAGILNVQTRLREIEKERLTRQRLTKIAEMNHHIRNALQVVVFCAPKAENPAVADTMKGAIRRIEWTLREVLPKGWELDGRMATVAPPTSDASKTDVSRQSDSK